LNGDCFPVEIVCLGEALIDRELELARERLPDTSTRPFDVDKIPEKIEGLGDLVDSAEPTPQKRLVNGLFERLEVHKDGVIVKMVPRGWARPFF